MQIPEPARRWRGHEPARDSADWFRWWEQEFVDAIRDELAYGPGSRGWPKGEQGRWASNVERLRADQGLHLKQLELLGEHPKTQFIMVFHQEDAGRDVGVFVNLWQVFTDVESRGSPRFSATLFHTWAMEPGGLAEPGIAMAWLNDAGEPEEWVRDRGSLLFRGQLPPGPRQ